MKLEPIIISLLDSDLYKLFPNTNKQSYNEAIQEKKTLSNSRLEELIHTLEEYEAQKYVYSIV